MMRSVSIVACILGIIPSALSCAKRVTGPNMTHTVEVPPGHRSGRGIRWVESDHERYLERYEAGWWLCVEKYANDITYQPTGSETRISGDELAIEAFTKGFQDATARIQQNVRLWGQEQTQAELKSLLQAK